MFKTLKKIKKLLEDNFGSSIDNYFIEDPNLIPMSMLPCFAVAPISTDIDILDTGRDEYVFTIDIFLIMSAKEDINKFKEEIVGTRFLTTTMEGRNSEGELNDRTVVNVLRSNLTLGTNWLINNIGNIDYGIRVRPEQGVTKEATMRIKVTRINRR